MSAIFLLVILIFVVETITRKEHTGHGWSIILFLGSNYVIACFKAKIGQTNCWSQIAPRIMGQSSIFSLPIEIDKLTCQMMP